MRNIVKPNADHQAFMNEIKAPMVKYNGKISELEMLALASQFVGILLAVQDQRSITKEQALSVIINNIEIGNATAIETMLGETKGNG